MIRPVAQPLETEAAPRPFLEIVIAAKIVAQQAGDVVDLTVRTTYTIVKNIGGAGTVAELLISREQLPEKEARLF